MSEKVVLFPPYAQRLADAKLEVAEIAAGLETYVASLHEQGLQYTFGLVRAMAVAVMNRGDCEPAEMVAGLRELAAEVEKANGLVAADGDSEKRQ
jgi:hypothetical protein